MAEQDENCEERQSALGRNWGKFQQDPLQGFRWKKYLSYF